mmetsp:Transcript_42796/g.76993  ORF Transcript_42796/g.76993 Transcript_42796/m.76993 type:complete len:1063 (-) Transcript_42796:105-3293(-)
MTMPAWLRDTLRLPCRLVLFCSLAATCVVASAEELQVGNVERDSLGRRIVMDADITGGMFLARLYPRLETGGSLEVKAEQAKPLMVSLVSHALLSLGIREAKRQDVLARVQAWRAQLFHKKPLEEEPQHQGRSQRASIGAGLCVPILLLCLAAVQRHRKAGSAASVKATEVQAVTPKRKAKAGPPPPPRMMNRPKAMAKKSAAPLRQFDMSLTNEGLSPRSMDSTPFGKKIHWVKPSCSAPPESTVFGEVSTSPRSSLQFDKSLMDAMFSPRGGGRTSPRAEKKDWTPRRERGICLLDNGRAQNAAIVLAKIQMDTQELRECIDAFDTGHPKLRADSIEMLMSVMPPQSEANKLLDHKDKAEQLREIERRLLPLCTLSPARMKIMKFATNHRSTYTVLLERCKVLHRAAMETRSSLQFRELLSIILQAGNYINSGDENSEEVKAFGIESLQSLASFKVGPISCMHFLCLTMRASDEGFLSCMEKSLSSVRTAAKEKFSQLRDDVEAFLGEVSFAKARLREMMPAPAQEEKVQAKDACEAFDDNDFFWYGRKSQVSESSRSSSKAATEVPESPAESLPSRPQSGNSLNEESGPEPLRQPSNEDLSRERLSMLLTDYLREADHLRQELAKASSASADVQVYFGVGPQVQGEVSAKGKGKGKGSQGPSPRDSEAAKPRQVPPEQFFLYVAGFLDIIQVSWKEIERQPGRWKHFTKSAKGYKASGAATLARQISQKKIPMADEADDHDCAQPGMTSSDSGGEPFSPRSPRGQPPQPLQSPRRSPLRRYPPEHAQAAVPLQSPQCSPEVAPEKRETVPALPKASLVPRLRLDTPVQGQEAFEERKFPKEVTPRQASNWSQRRAPDLLAHSDGAAEPQKVAESPRFPNAANQESGSRCSSEYGSRSDAESKSSLASFAGREAQARALQRLAHESHEEVGEQRVPSSSPEPDRQFSFKGGENQSSSATLGGGSRTSLSRADIVPPLHISSMKAKKGSPHLAKARLRSPSPSDDEPGANGEAVNDDDFCQFHKLHADSDLEIHNMADSDSASCATETDGSDDVEDRRVGG